MAYLTDRYDCTQRRGTTPHGHVLHDYCDISIHFDGGCPYTCFYGYEKPTNYRDGNLVFCNKESRRWETIYGNEPCTPGKPSSRRSFHFDIPTAPRTFPLSTRRWMKYTFPTFIPQIPSVWPTYKPNPPFINNVNMFPSYTTTPNPGGDSAGAVTFAIIMAIIIGSAFLLIGFCICLVKFAAARRRVKSQTRARRNVVILRNEYSPPPHRRSQIEREFSVQNIQSNASSSTASTTIPHPVPDDAPSSNNAISDNNPQSGQNDEEDRGLVFLYIRRLIPIFRNPFPPAQNPPEPPPYDAESVPPPAYEDVGTVGSSTVQTPIAPPPPYSITI